MNVLVVVESLFGNTRDIAEAIAAALRGCRADVSVEVVPVADAPAEIPAEVALLLVGGPTHAFSMTRESSRADAIKQGALRPSSTIGVREWIECLTARADLAVVTFDTRMKVRGMPGSAAKSAAKALRKNGIKQAERGPTFWVAGKAGPLAEGELSKAQAWGISLGTRLEKMPNSHPRAS